MQTSGVRATFYTFFGEVKNLAHVCEFVALWSLRTIASQLLAAAQLRYRTGTSIKTKKRKPLFGRTSTILGCKQVGKGVIWRT